MRGNDSDSRCWVRQEAMAEDPKRIYCHACEESSEVSGNRPLIFQSCVSMQVCHHTNDCVLLAQKVSNASKTMLTVRSHFTRECTLSDCSIRSSFDLWPAPRKCNLPVMISSSCSSGQINTLHVCVFVWKCRSQTLHAAASTRYAPSKHFPQLPNLIVTMCFG